MHLIEEMRTVSCILKEIHLYLLLLLSHKYITIYVHVVKIFNCMECCKTICNTKL